MAEAMPEIDQSICTLCGDCLTACPEEALSLVSHRVMLNESRCRYCGDCEDVCPIGAIRLPYEIVLGSHDGDAADDARVDT